MERGTFHASSRPGHVENLVGILIPVIDVLMLVLERVFPAHSVHHARGVHAYNYGRDVAEPPAASS